MCSRKRFNDGLGELSSTGELIAMSSSAVYLIDPDTGSINSSFTLVSGFSPRGVTSVDGEIYVGFTTLSADSTDAGTPDIHSVTVDWGDGTTSGGTITQGAGFGSLLAEHVYATGGIYTVTVTLFDDDTGSDSFETVVAVTGIGLTSEGVLQIVGTASADLVTVVQVDGMSFRVQADFLTDPEQYRDFYLSDVESLQIFMCEGDDQVNIGGNIELSAFVDAGAGNDNVIGGSGNDVILGSPGDDHLNGGDGRDILIVGQSDGDLLMGGRTAYDGDPTTNRLPDFGAWESLLTRWSGPGDAAARAANLADDSIDGFFLTLGVTVFDDGDQDELTGGSKSDWFWALGDDLLTDAQGVEGDLNT